MPGEPVKARPTAPALLDDTKNNLGVSEDEVLPAQSATGLRDPLGSPKERPPLLDVNVLLTEPLVSPHTRPFLFDEVGRDPGNLVKCEAVLEAGPGTV